MLSVSLNKTFSSFLIYLMLCNVCMYVCIYLNSNCCFFPGFFNRCYLCMYVYVCMLFMYFIEREREMSYLTMHSTHFIYSYMASDLWLRTLLILRKETRCCHIGYSYRLTARVLLYAPSHRQDNTYHGLFYTSRGVYFIDACMYL